MLSQDNEMPSPPIQSEQHGRTTSELWASLRCTLTQKIHLKSIFCMLLHGLLIFGHVALIIYTYSNHKTKPKSDFFLTAAGLAIDYVPSYVFKVREGNTVLCTVSDELHVCRHTGHYCSGSHRTWP